MLSCGIFRPHCGLTLSAPTHTMLHGTCVSKLGVVCKSEMHFQMQTALHLEVEVSPGFRRVLHLDVEDGSPSDPHV